MVKQKRRAKLGTIYLHYTHEVPLVDRGEKPFFGWMKYQVANNTDPDLVDSILCYWSGQTVRRLAVFSDLFVAEVVNYSREQK